MSLLATAVPRSLSWGPSTAQLQGQLLKNLVAKHLTEDLIAEFETATDFTSTSTDRGLGRWEHPHLVAALDVVNAYQQDRRSRSSARLPVLDWRVNMRRQFKADPRTRFVELLKRWLRTNAANASVEEDAVRRITGLCRDVLNHRSSFPARNKRSFMHTVAEVYGHMQWQLREVLERDRSCAELAGRALSLGRNLLSDAISYLLLAATDLKQTDTLPSVEAVALWQSLPSGPSCPLPSRADVKSQKVMKDAWQTCCGSLIAALLSTPWSVRLFDGRGAQEEAHAAAADALQVASSQPAPSLRLPELVAAAEADFLRGSFRYSGLAGPLRLNSRATARKHYLSCVMLIFDISFLLGEVLVQFQRISEGFGDYGMIRSAAWLHPFLEALTEKVMQLRSNLDRLSKEVDDVLVLERMSKRANEALQRAVSGRDPHVQALLHSLDELKAKSAPDRLPDVTESIMDACESLKAIFASEMFRARIGSEAEKWPAANRLEPGALQLNDAARLPATATPVALPPHSSSIALVDKQESDRSEFGASPSSESTASTAVSSSEATLGLQAAVWRLVGALSGFRRHDRRSLSIKEGKLLICEPSSCLSVKTEVDICQDIDEQGLCGGGGKMLSLFMRRKPKSSRAGLATEKKVYFFEFDSADEARKFITEIRRIQQAACRDSAIN